MNTEEMKKFKELWSQVSEKKKLDPVGKADADIDNDGDVDSSDEYLHKRRKAIKKSMKENEVEPEQAKDGMKKCPECGGSMENHHPECSKYTSSEKKKMKEDDRNTNEAVDHKKQYDRHMELHYKHANKGDWDKAEHHGKKAEDHAEKHFKKTGKKIKDPGYTGDSVHIESVNLDAKSAEKALKHDCASHVTSEQWGYGECIPGQHTLEETAEGEARVTHYDVMFEHGVEFNVPVEELTIVAEKNHSHKAKKEAMTPKQKQKAQKSASSNKSYGKVRDRLGEDLQEGTVGELEQEIEQAYSSLQQRAVESMKKMWEDKSHTKGATPPEKYDDHSSERDKKVIAQHKKSDKEFEDKEEKGHDDATAAGRVTKQAPARTGDIRKGDLKPEMPKDTTKV